MYRNDRFRKVLMAGLLAWVSLSAAAGTMSITVSVPGPGNLSYLPLDLIARIGADRAEGARVELLHTGGGGVALSNLKQRNSDFAVAGVPAIMSHQANGHDVRILMPVDDAPLFVLMVRSALRGQVRSVSDLRGRTIGVNTSSLSSKTTSQQLAELVLQSAGVPLDEVRFVPGGQSWVEQSSLLLSGTADALMGDEPFASRLEAGGQVFFLLDLSRPQESRRIPGGGFLHAALGTRPEVIEQSPQKVEKMVRILRRTLRWIATHTPEQVVDALGLPDGDERQALLRALGKYPRLYSLDGRFSTRQLHDTELFFHTASGTSPRGRALRIESMVIDRWAGRRP